MTSRNELRLITCLFLDVVGSTDATVKLGPERMHRLLDEAFKEMSTTIAAHGGVVEKYVGDAILALFGASVAHADDAERALRAAEACARWSSASAATGVGLSVRAGIETGEVLVDLAALENRQRMVVGEIVNLAARLQNHAEPGQIVVGPTCLAATVGIAEYEPLGLVPLKGIGDVEAWRFAGFRDGDAGLGLEFVGRTNELAILREALDRARDGDAVLALIIGPPGQGKSRLVSEAIRRAGTFRVLEARCRPGTETGANSPLRQLVEADLPGASAEGVSKRLSDLLGTEEGHQVAAAINHSAGLAVDGHLLAINRYEQRELIALAWRRYFEAVARDIPLAVAIEDVHWADPLLLRVIDHVTTDLRSSLVVLATARPEFVGSAHLRPREGRLQIDLGPLDRAEAERLVELAAEGDAGAAASVERAGGNPLFLIELSRARSRQGELPVTVQAAIAARLDELTAEERELLQRTSVVGEAFDLRDVALLNDREPGAVVAALGRFTHLGFVTPVGPAYRFHHALVREVAYGRLPVSEQMELHARYATEGVDPGDVEALAHHWWQALRPPDAEWVWDDQSRLAAMRREAYRVHMAAGARLEERNAYEEALEVYLHAVELADATTDLAAAEAAVGRGYVKQGLGDEAWTHRNRAIGLYREAGERPPAGLYADMLEITAFNWGYFQHLPDDEEVARLLEEGIEVARATGDEPSLARLLAERAGTTGDETGTEAIRDFLESPEAVRFADAAQRMATVYTWAGRIADAVAVFRIAFDRLLPAGAAFNEPEALAWYGLAAFTGGDLATADALAERLEVEAERRSVHTRSHAHGLKALARFGRGDWEGLEAAVGNLHALVDAHPEAPMCLVSAAAEGFGAVAELRAGRPLPANIDERALRHVDDSERVRAASVMLPKVMAGQVDALDRGLRGYEDGLRLWDRFRAWDVADLCPAISLTMLERWDHLGPTLARLDAFGQRGARMAEATAAAIREEAAAAAGGPTPEHRMLRELGYLGISELLRFRPVPT
jgi:class 3 adenylate cyclase/tetratricopeptide (TPR) repeat protein